MADPATQTSGPAGHPWDGHPILLSTFLAGGGVADPGASSPVPPGSPAERPVNTTCYGGGVAGVGGLVAAAGVGGLADGGSSQVSESVSGGP